MDDSGRVTKASFVGGSSRSVTYNPERGFIENITVQGAASQTLYTVDYGYTLRGDTKSRQSNYFNSGNSSRVNETYTYSADGHFRLEKRDVAVTSPELLNNLVTSMSQSFSYDALGNIKTKSGIGSYEYDSSNPYRLRQTTGASSGNRSYVMSAADYDVHGNIKADGQRTFSYNQADLVTTIAKGSDLTSFVYAPDNSRIYREDKRNNVISKTWYLGKVYEFSQKGNDTEQRWYLGNVVLTQASKVAGMSYDVLHGDAQGSTVTVTDGAGKLISHSLYDAWGQQSVLQVGTTSQLFVQSLQRRAYTGHENIEGLGIIHMNGRIYDATLARFMQADPFVQAPTNTQSYNRYSYVLNNPLSYTDPSGFISLGKIGKWLRDIADVPVLDAIISVALYVIPGCQGWCTAIYQGLKTTAVTGSLGAGLRAGALSAAMPGGANLGNAALNFVVDGVVGGIFSVLGGGKFGHGFISSSVGNAFAGAGGSNPYARITVSSLIGGTVSSFTGGKFANGAISSAFASTVREFRSGSFNSSETSGGSCSKCGQVSLGNIDNLSYDQLSDIRSGLIDARNAGYDSVSINDALKRINSRIGDIIGIPSFTQSEVLRGVIRDHINSKSEPVFAGLDNAATLAGFCSLPQCSAFSWGVAGVNMLRSGSSSGLISNGIGEMFNRYWSSRIPGGGVYSDLAQGTTGYLIGEGVSSHQEKLKQGN